MSEEMIGEIADILVDDHVNVLLENHRLREKIKKDVALMRQVLTELEEKYQGHAVALLRARLEKTK